MTWFKAAHLRFRTASVGNRRVARDKPDYHVLIGAARIALEDLRHWRHDIERSGRYDAGRARRKDMQGETIDIVPVTFRVTNARPVQAKELFALVDVEVLIGGVAFDILGVQARREPENQTSVRLPTFKDADGTWRPAIRLPNEVCGPLADAVLTFLMEEGLAKHRFELPPEPVER